MGRRVCVVGSSNVDLVTRVARWPDPGETLAADGFATGPGGKGANQAVAAALNGGEVALVTRVGEDAFGAQLLARYVELGIDTSHAQAAPGMSTGTATILVERSGENRILVAAGANAALTPAAVDAAADLLRGSALVVLQLEVPPASVRRAIDICTAAGVEVLFNPAPIDGPLEASLATQARILIPNRGELARLAGRSLGSMEQVEAAARALVDQGVGTLIVTLGAEGALIVEASRTHRVPAPRVAVADTTGAGDAFIGAFAADWVATRDVDRSVAAAVAYAADSTTRAGAQASYADRRGRERRDAPPQR